MDLISNIVAAIIRQEGRKSDETNPGNLRAAPWLTNVPMSGNFWRPDSRAEGVAGIYHCIALMVAEHYTLSQVIYRWAPPQDGNATMTYINNVKTWCGIADEHVPLFRYLVEPKLQEKTIT